MTETDTASSAHTSSAQTSSANEIRDHVRAISSRLLDATDRVLDSMTPQAAPAPPIAVSRRQTANALRLWKFCARSRCRRGQCCQGEPLDCLRIAVTILPPEAFEPLLARGKGAVRRARSKTRRATGEMQAAP